MSNISLEKSLLRDRGLAHRRGMSEEEYRIRSTAVLARLKELEVFTSASLVMTYAAQDREVDTMPLIVALPHEGRRVALPTVAQKGDMLWREVSSREDLVPGRYGILEPSPSGQLIECVTSGAVILVPGILFSMEGYRIGYGGGYFDRFLPDSPGTSIGLAFDFQVARSLPVESHDEPVDWLVCETEVFDCGKVRRVGTEER